MRLLGKLVVLVTLLPTAGSAQNLTYRWKPNTDSSQCIQARIPPPAGFHRIRLRPGSFADWLRHLPLKPGRPPVHLFDGRLKFNQSAHAAVVDMDVGQADLQQCADAVMRLRAEYLFTTPCANHIAFHFTSGDLARWRDWRRGYRPRVQGNHVTWRQTAKPSRTYANFKRYLRVVFTYAGSASLERELVPVSDPRRVQIGDVFIHGGHPGHAVIVVDMAENDRGERVFLLAQSYMPAQEIHVLHSPEPIDPWYHARAAGTLETPEWTFEYRELRRFRLTSCEQ